MCVAKQITIKGAYFAHTLFCLFIPDNESGTCKVGFSGFRLSTSPKCQASWSAWTRKTTTAVTRCRASVARWRSTIGSPTSSRSIPLSTKFEYPTKKDVDNCRFPSVHSCKDGRRRSGKARRRPRQWLVQGLHSCARISCLCFTCQWSRKTVLARGSCFVRFTAGFLGRLQCRLFCRESGCHVSRN